MRLALPEEEAVEASELLSAMTGETLVSSSSSSSSFAWFVRFLKVKDGLPSAAAAAAADAEDRAVGAGAPMGCSADSAASASFLAWLLPRKWHCGANHAKKASNKVVKKGPQ